MKIYVIILNWNGKGDTLTCLENLEYVTTPHHVVVVDNGSSDGSEEAIRKKFPQVYLIQTGENLGYAEGNNVGIRYALENQADFLFILNNDTIVTKDILEHFLKRDVPIQGGKALLMEDPQKIDHLGGNWNPKQGRFELVGANAPASEWKNPVSIDYVCGVALFAKAEVFEKVGLFDPRFFLFWEECDWCYRAKQAGYLIQTCPEALLFHKKSASFTGGKPHTCYFWWRNRLLWIEKNCKGKELRHLKLEILKDYLQALKHFILKTLQYPFARKTYERRLRYRFYRALLTGIHHYHFRRFGNCPKWLFNKI